MSLQPFHLAVPVSNLKQAEEFYGNILKLSKGRENEKWIDWNFFGHQFVTHLKSDDKNNANIINLSLIHI